MAPDGHPWSLRSAAARQARHAQQMLEEVREIAVLLERQHESFEEALEDAWRSGASLRSIADAAGISHEQVRRVVRRRISRSRFRATPVTKRDDSAENIAG